MVGTQRYRLAPAGCIDQGLVVNRHRHRLAHLRVHAQDLVVEVEVHGLEIRRMGVGGQLVVGQTLVGNRLGHIQEPGGVDGARLQVLEDGVLIGHDAENHTIQVRQPLGGQVVVGVAHHRIVIPWLALLHHEGAAGDRWVQVVRRGDDLVRSNPHEMVRRQRRVDAIGPDGQER